MVMDREEMINGLENAMEYIVENAERIGEKEDGMALYEDHIEFMLDAIEDAMKTV